MQVVESVGDFGILRGKQRTGFGHHRHESAPRVIQFDRAITRAQHRVHLLLLAVRFGAQAVVNRSLQPVITPKKRVDFRIFLPKSARIRLRIEPRHVHRQADKRERRAFLLVVIPERVGFALFARVVGVGRNEIVDGLRVRGVRPIENQFQHAIFATESR